MTRDEFKTWADDFKARFPETGLWMSKLPKETRDVWFSDYFAELELRDCLAVNHLLVQQPEDIDGFKRERIPGVFVKRCQQVNYTRQQREEKVRRHKSHGGGFFAPGNPQAVDSRSDMLACLQQAEQIVDEYRRKDFIDQWFDERDPIRTAREWCDNDESQLKAVKVNRFAV